MNLCSILGSGVHTPWHQQMMCIPKKKMWSRLHPQPLNQWRWCGKLSSCATLVHPVVLDLLRLVCMSLWQPESFGFRLIILICPAVDQLFVHSVNVLCYGDKVQLVSPMMVNLQNLELKYESSTLHSQHLSLQTFSAFLHIPQAVVIFFIIPSTRNRYSPITPP